MSDSRLPPWNTVEGLQRVCMLKEIGSRWANGAIDLFTGLLDLGLSPHALRQVSESRLSQFDRRAS